MEIMESSPPVATPPERVRIVVAGRAWATPALIGLNACAFLWMLWRGVGLFGPDGQQALALGANEYHAVRLEGQWWRLVTSTFLHGGILHLAVNMWALRVLGPFIEAYLGPPAFLALYLVSGVAASVVSIHWDHDVVSLGASGSIFALLGAHLAFFVRHRSELPRAVFRAQVRNVLMLIGLNVLLGLSIPHIDNAAHLGGLAWGILGGFLLDRDLLAVPRMGMRRWLGAAGLALLIPPLAFAVGIASALVHGRG
ncbi:MAG: rhomboid family intramembrane serine protease [Planctomycetes bacterium]|nr:rhomboid family intramembrane serine protease [Planctomycetota bacterium]